MKEPRRRRRRTPAPEAGDRALERLHQFEQERGLEETDVEHPKPDKPLAVEENEKQPTEGS